MLCGIDVFAKPDFDDALAGGCERGDAAIEEHVNTRNDNKLYSTLEG